MNKNNAGRNCMYFTQVQPFLKDIEEWLDKGASLKQCARNLGVPYSTFNAYKKQFEELDKICKKLRKPVILELRSALVTRALGFTHTTRKAIKVKDVFYDNGKKTRETEKVIYYDEDTYFPPDTTAIFGALNLYDPEYVKDKKNYELKKKQLNLQEKLVEEKIF